jgi:HrpA-like RNA helicase
MSMSLTASWSQIVRESIEEAEALKEAFKTRACRLASGYESISDMPEDVKAELRREIRRFMPPGGRCLPFYAYQEAVMDMIKTNRVCIVIGETGSGKSTQLIQYMRSSGYFPSDKKIVCTQPRKVAAINLATRVAEEWDGEQATVGKNVGYQVGTDEKMEKTCNLMFVTNRFLLNAIMADEALSDYAAVIVDEAHERSINTDLVMGMLKRTMDLRNKDPDDKFRVIITSATLDEEAITKYFDLTGNAAAVQRIPGRTFPIEVEYMDEPSTAGLHLVFWPLVSAWFLSLF